MEAIAKELLGEPNARKSSNLDHRFGSQGYLSINLEKDSWYDFERDIGGGPVEFVQDRVGGSPSDARRWLEERGYRGCTTDAGPRKPRVVATYPYRDETGGLLFEVLRMDPKDFRQRRPDGKGGYEWSTKGTRKVLYRLPEITRTDSDAIVFLVEGEKDADRLANLGLVATTNPGGASKWRSDYSKSLVGRRIVVLPDNDEAGRNHAEVVAGDLKPAAQAFAILKLDGLPEKGDVSDWLAAGGTRQRLLELAEAALAAAGTPPPPEPMPILRPRGTALDIPREALGPLLPAVVAIETITQAPAAIAMQSVLASASLAAQAHADVETLGGPAPISLFQLSIAESGERKSACDRIATRAIRDFERQKVRDHPAL